MIQILDVDSLEEIVKYEKLWEEELSKYMKSFLN
jgi:hypothetical protein